MTAHHQPPRSGWRPPEPVAGWLRVALDAFVLVALASTAALVGVASAAEPREPGIAHDVVRALWPVQLVVSVVILVLVVVWLRRLAANHVALARPGTRFATPGWAVGSWLLWFVLPFLVVRELWKGSDPAVPEGSPAWTAVPTSPMVVVWFLTFVAGMLATNLTSAALEPDAGAGVARWRAGATAVLVVSALVLRRLSRALTDRQQALIATT